MKAVMEPCVRSTHPGLSKRDARCIAGKTSGKKSDFDSQEMRACFSKLMELVPAPKSHVQHVDKTELLQNVIDYIYQLQDMLHADFSSDSLCVLQSESSARAGFLSLSTSPSLPTVDTVTSQ